MPSPALFGDQRKDPAIFLDQIVGRNLRLMIAQTL